MVLYLHSELQVSGPVVQWIECRFPEPKVPRSSRGGVTDDQNCRNELMKCSK